MKDFSLVFIAGVYSARGCFTQHLKVQKSNRDYRHFCIGLYMRKEDRSFIEHIKVSMSGIGNVTINKTNNTVMYRITKIQDLEAFAEHVGPLLQGRKAEEFKELCEFLHGYKHRNWNRR